MTRGGQAYRQDSAELICSSSLSKVGRDTDAPAGESAGRRLDERGAAVVISQLTESLTRVLAMGGLGKRPGHAPSCQQGIWAGKYVPPAYPDGSPCSERCQAMKSALEMAERWRNRKGS